MGLQIWPRNSPNSSTKPNGLLDHWSYFYSIYTRSLESGIEASWCQALYIIFLNVKFSLGLPSRSKFGRMYRGKRGFQTLLQTGIYHFLKLSRGVWPFCKIIEGSLSLKKETNWFKAKIRKMLIRTPVSFMVFRTVSTKSGTFKLYRSHFMRQMSPFPAYWRYNWHATTGLFFQYWFHV